MISSRYFKSILLVAVQFLCLGLIALTGPLVPSNYVLLAVQLLGLGIGVWAVFSMRIGNFNILPDPLSWSSLVTSGPYKFVRHPMYLALLLVTLPAVLESFNLFRFAVWLVLLTDLLVKLNYEENLLRSKLEGYQQYIRESFHLIPFVY